jgi:hypothetical protein
MLMKSRLMLGALLLTLAPTALASTTWYVNGVTGSDSNNCMSPTTACLTIGHAISLASLGDTIMVAAAIYGENLTIPFGLTIDGAGPLTTKINGGERAPAVVILAGNVTLSGLTIQGGQNGPGGPCGGYGGGICGTGSAVTIVNCLITGNVVTSGNGGGIYTTAGSLTINKSTIRGNLATEGGGILSNGFLQVNNTTIVGNFALNGQGGGLSSESSAYITNSTISENGATTGGGGVFTDAGGRVFINNTTISGNTVNSGQAGAGVYADSISITMQNSIVANNLGSGNCAGTAKFTSSGYNLSSDNTCHLTGPGDLNNTDPKLGPLQNNGGPTQTMALMKGSPAIDTGNPAGCTDGVGHLLKTDQRGAPRPDPGDSGGCDIGAYETQN